MKVKNGVIVFVIVFCCLTVVPLILLLLNTFTEGWDDSVIGKMINEIS